MATEKLSVKITADAQNFSSELSKMYKQLDEAKGKFEGLSKAGDSMKNVGKKLTAGLTLPIAGVAGASVKTAADFEASMNKVSATSGATGSDLEKLSNLAKDMGASTKFSASESAEALNYMAMAGWKTSDMMAGLPGILNLAAAGGTDLALTSDIVTDGLTGLGMSASDTQSFVDTMAATCSNANTNIELMGETLKYAGPVAGSLGIDMKDLSLAIGLMGNAGIKGSMAGTSLKAGLVNLAKPTKQMQEYMDRYGVSLKTTEDGQVDLMGTINNLRSKLGGLSEVEQASALSAIFGKEAMSGWASIVNASEKDFNKLSGAIKNSDGASQKMSDTMQKGLKGATVQMKSALEGVAITIGERLSPFFEKLANGVTKLAGKFQSLSPTAQTVILAIAGIIAAIGPLLMIGGSLAQGFVFMQAAALLAGTSIGGLITAFLGLVSPIVAVVAGVGVFITALVKAYNENETFRNKVNEVFNNVKEIISNVMSIISNIISMAWSLITTIWNNGLSQILGFVGNILASIVGKFTEKLNRATNIVKTAIALIKAIFSGDFKGATDIINGILSSIVNGFNSKMDKARNVVKGAIDKIKSFFNFSWSLPKLKLPHLSITGGFNIMPPSVPKFSVSWYSKGAIFKRPTVMGGMGVGDAHNGIGSNAEAILPINKLPELLGLDKKADKVVYGDIPVSIDIDGRMFMRTVAKYDDELGRYNTRNPKFAY